MIKNKNLNLVIILSVFVLVAIFATGYFFLTNKNSQVSAGREQNCIKHQGKWLSMYQECELRGISDEQEGKKICQTMKANYTYCSSACRHNPNAQFCIGLCVPICTF